MSIFKKATKEKLKLKIALQGASGSGKTYSALRLAHGIESNWEKIFYIDTENKSATYYSEQFEFQHHDMQPPYHPEKFIEIIDAAIAAGASVIIIDSLSAEWEGEGGCLDLADKVSKSMRNPNTFTAWKDITPRHNKFIDHLRLSPVHIIACSRSKQEYSIEKGSDGKNKVVKLGMKEVQRDNVSYEFGIVFEIDGDHMAYAGKDRTGLYADKPRHQITEETGKELLRWANSGKEEIYTGTNQQKIAMAKICRDEHAIDDKKMMAEISEALIKQGIAFSALENSIANYIAERTI